MKKKNLAVSEFWNSSAVLPSILNSVVYLSSPYWPCALFYYMNLCTISEFCSRISLISYVSFTFSVLLSTVLSVQTSPDYVLFKKLFSKLEHKEILERELDLVFTQLCCGWFSCVAGSVCQHSEGMHCPSSSRAEESLNTWWCCIPSRCHWTLTRQHSITSQKIQILNVR